MRKYIYGRQTWWLMSSYETGRASTYINNLYRDGTTIWVDTGICQTWLVLASDWLAYRTAIDAGGL